MYTYLANKADSDQYSASGWKDRQRLVWLFAGILPLEKPVNVLVVEEEASEVGSCGEAQDPHQLHLPHLMRWWAGAGRWSMESRRMVSGLSIVF